MFWSIYLIWLMIPFFTSSLTQVPKSRSLAAEKRLTELHSYVGPPFTTPGMGVVERARSLFLYLQVDTMRRRSGKADLDGAAEIGQKRNLVGDRGI